MGDWIRALPGYAAKVAKRTSSRRDTWYGILLTVFLFSVWTILPLSQTPSALLLEKMLLWLSIPLFLFVFFSSLRYPPKAKSEATEQSRALLEEQRELLTSLGGAISEIVCEVNNPLALIQLEAGVVKDLMNDATPDKAYIARALLRMEKGVSRTKETLDKLNVVSRSAYARTGEAKDLRALLDAVHSFTK